MTKPKASLTVSDCAELDEHQHHLSDTMTQREKKKKIHIHLFYDLIVQDGIILFSSHFLCYLIAFRLFVCFLAAQKARDEFNEVERSLREVSDQIR